MPNPTNVYAQPWDGYQGHLYDKYAAHNTYELVSGTFELPVAENPPTDPQELAQWSPVVVVQAFAPCRKRNVRFTASKKGNPPVLPSPESAGAFTFLGGMLEFSTPRADASFTKFDWTVSGQYTFVETVRSDVQDGFVLGGPPFTLTTQEVNANTGANYQPQFGAVSLAGSDAKIGYSQAVAQDASSPTFLYNTVTYYPGKLFNASTLNGDVRTGV